MSEILQLHEDKKVLYEKKSILKEQMKNVEEEKQQLKNYIIELEKRNI